MSIGFFNYNLLFCKIWTKFFFNWLISFSFDSMILHWLPPESLKSFLYKNLYELDIFFGSNRMMSVPDSSYSIFLSTIDWSKNLYETTNFSSRKCIPLYWFLLSLQKRDFPTTLFATNCDEKNIKNINSRCFNCLTIIFIFTIDSFVAFHKIKITFFNYIGNFIIIYIP